MNIKLRRQIQVISCEPEPENSLKFIQIVVIDEYFVCVIESDDTEGLRSVVSDLAVSGPHVENYKIYLY